MRPLLLKLENFQSHESTVIDFLGIECAVLIGPNGAGKSSIPDAIMFALFGEVRGGNLDSVVTHGEELCKVEFTFALNGSTYLVSRQRSSKGAGKTTLSFQCDGQVLDGKTVAETQQRIIDTTRLTADLLRATAVSSQGDADAFSRATAADRKGYLGDILGLAHYDRLAQAARDMQKARQADRDGKATALSTAQTVAAQVLTIEEQLADTTKQAAELEADRTVASGAIDHFTAEREQTVKAQAADEAARKELHDLRSRQTGLTADEIPAKAKLGHLQFTIGGAGDTLVAIEAAEAAQKQAAVFETRQKERDRLKGEGKVLAERVKGSKASHADSVRAVERDAEASKRDHARDLKALREAIGGFEEQEKLLAGVPCADTAMADKCPLIESAMRSRTILPAKRKELETLETQRPWAEQEKRLEALRSEEPWRADAAANTRLKEAHDAIEYDADAHSEAIAKGAKLPDLQKQLAGMEAAREQTPDATAALEKISAELKQVTERVTALETELGEATDWPAKLTGIDSRRAAATEDLARIGRELDAARQQQGALTERLKAAQEAAEQAKALETEMADLDRRIQVLKILGNPRDGAFSKGGIPALLIDQAVPALEEAANEVLSTLSDGRMALELRTQRENNSGTMSETLDIVCFVDGVERLREALSGGEGTRFDLALRAGMALLLTERAGARCELLVLDEPPGLDERGQDELVDCLGKLSAHFSTILLVTHIERLRDALPVRLEVSRDAEGSSKVEVIYQ